MNRRRSNPFGLSQIESIFVRMKIILSFLHFFLVLNTLQLTDYQIKISKDATAADPEGSCQPIIWPNFVENCMKIKKIGLWERPKFYYVESATARCLLDEVVTVSVHKCCVTPLNLRDVLSRSLSKFV